MRALKGQSLGEATSCAHYIINYDNSKSESIELQDEVLTLVRIQSSVVSVLC